MQEQQIIIKTLTPALLSDWLTFFDNDAFIDNPGWSSCYCQFYHDDHQEKDWSDRSGDENRSAAMQLIHQRRLHGHLAYASGKAVGWCQAAPRMQVPNLQINAELHSEDLDQVGAILCFLVAPAYRAHGVGQMLLEAACQGLVEQGVRIAEGYPRRAAKSNASNYHGPLSMYLQAGFAPYREFDDYLIVRRGISPQTSRD